MSIPRNKVRVDIECGTVLCNSDRAGLSLHFTMNMADEGGLFVLTVQSGRGKAENFYLGAAEWPKFLAMVRDGERLFRKEQADGRCSELTPCPPG